MQMQLFKKINKSKYFLVHAHFIVLYIFYLNEQIELECWFVSFKQIDQ